MIIHKLALVAVSLGVALGSSMVFAKKSGSGSGSHSVRGHFKKDGTYVEPHHATNPNNTQKDNWSSKPNVNPYTGKKGTKDPDH